MSKKFLITGVLVITILASTIFTSILAFAKENEPLSLNNLMFKDVDLKNENFDAIYFGYNSGFVEGFQTDQPKIREFKPEKTVNRAEFLKIVLEGTEKADDKKYSQCFSDVPANSWFNSYVCQAKKEGIISGYPDQTFRPEQTINEAEALKILLELQNLKIEKADPDEQWYANYWKAGENRNILSETKADKLMTRADVMEMVFRNLQVEKLKIKSFDEKYTDELMDTYEIPYDNVLGPGGVFGPSGPTGTTGPGIYFTDKELPLGQESLDKTELIQLLNEDYFDEHHCYFSDSGDFTDLVIPTLERITGGNIDQLKLEGYNMDGFGTMFCYNDPIITDLATFTNEFRNEYDITCWRDPLNSASIGGPTNNNGKFENIFCYVESLEPEWDGYCEAIEKNGEICEACYDNVIDRNLTDISCQSENNTSSSDDSAATISVSATGPIPTAVFANSQNIALLKLNLTAKDEDVTVERLTIHSIGKGNPSALKEIYLTEKNGNGEKISSVENIISPLISPVLDLQNFTIPKNSSKTLELKGDFDWEYDNGPIQLGLLSSGDLILSNGKAELSTTIQGPVFTRNPTDGLEIGTDGDLCAFLDNKTNRPFGESQNPPATGSPIAGEAPAIAPPAEAHKVQPINQDAQANKKVCMAAANYSSLRWFEERFEIRLIENGQIGLNKLIQKLHNADMTDARTQLEALMEFLNDNYPGCISSTYNTQSWLNVTCFELKRYKNQGCDIPLQFMCQEVDAAGNNVGKEWGHAVDLTEVTINPNDTNECDITFANSWAADDGSGEDMDGLGAGRYEQANYNDDTEVFTPTSPWGANYKCRLFSAAYICIDENKCK